MIKFNIIDRNINKTVHTTSDIEDLYSFYQIYTSSLTDQELTDIHIIATKQKTTGMTKLYIPIDILESVIKYGGY